MSPFSPLGKSSGLTGVSKISNKVWATSFVDSFSATYLTKYLTSVFGIDGPKVGSISLSPRGDWRMPSDASFNCFK